MMMRRDLRLLLLASLAGMLAACGGGMWPEIVNAREVARAGGAPSVERVRDLGNLENLPEGGAIQGVETDGVFVVGEHVLIEGDDFGKLPTILIGGRPAGVVARTDGGGIITRIPDGVPVGEVPVEVSHPNGKNSKKIQVRRYGLIAQSDGGKIYVMNVGARDAGVEATVISVENPRFVRYSPDGSVAYVASGVASGAEGGKGSVAGKISVIGMGTKGGPRIVQNVPLTGRIVTALAVAERAELMAVVGETSLQLLSIRLPRHPAAYREFQLPEGVARAGVVTADLDPTGKVLALLLSEGNKLAIFDVARPERPRLVTTIELLPDQRVPLVRDMRFSVDGGTLWVVSGDNNLSIAAGKQPTRITVVSIDSSSGDPVVKVERTSAVSGATAPMRLSVARGQPLASGTTIRTPPEKAAVFISTIDSRLLQLATIDMFKPEGREKAVQILKPVGEPGMLVRTDLEGGGGPLFTVPNVISSIDLSPDSQMLLGTTCAIQTEGGADKLTFEFGVTITALWGSIKPRFVKLADMQPDAFKLPFSIGHVRIQP
jgi:hypothetical protein